MTDRQAFEALYAEDPDPWRFTSSPYEREKYRRTVRALQQRKFTAALEIGCSIGVLTVALARNCRRLLAIDIAEAPLAEARRRARGHPGVTVRRLAVPECWPGGSFDLIVVSEVLYFLNAAEVLALAGHVGRTLRPGGLLVLVNWTGPTDTALNGQAATGLMIGALRGRLRPVTRKQLPRYRLDILRRPGRHHI